MARDGNSASNILLLALNLLLNGRPPLALSWCEMDRHTSFHTTNPWSGLLAQPLADLDGTLRRVLEAAALAPMTRGEREHSNPASPAPISSLQHATGDVSPLAAAPGIAICLLVGCIGNAHRRLSPQSCTTSHSMDLLALLLREVI